MFIYATPFNVWIKTLTIKEIQDYKIMYSDYDNPLHKAYCVYWED